MPTVSTKRSPANRYGLALVPVDDSVVPNASYYADGRVKSARDAGGHVTSYQYDAAGRQTKVTNAKDQSTTFTFDDAGNQVTVTDAKTNTTTSVYDALNRLERTSPRKTNASAAWANTFMTGPCARASARASAGCSTFASEAPRATASRPTKPAFRLGDARRRRYSCSPHRRHP